MTNHVQPTHQTEFCPPVLLVVDADPEARSAMESALVRRFGADYQVLAVDSINAGLGTLEHLARQRVDVALVAADLHLPGSDGLAFLQQASTWHPRASRGLLVAMDHRGTRIPFGDLTSLQRATTLGRIDFWVMKGTESPEELLFPRVQEALTAWTRANRPIHEVFQVLGERWAPRSHALRDTMGRNTVPFRFYPADTDEGQRLLHDHGVDAERLPAVILHDGSVLHNPSDAEVAAALGVRTQPPTKDFDLAIIGAGPAGLTAAVYGTSEGLDTLVIEHTAVGGQAGMSSMIRNYPGFPQGVSGGELAFRTFEQTLLFGTEYIFTQQATGIRRCGTEYRIVLSGGSEACAKTVIIAAGVAYRRLGIPSLERLTGVGVFYGAAGVEAPAMTGKEVYVVGAANSAGQAALHLAKFAERVTLLVRGESLATSMSNYLITQIEATPNVKVRLQTQVADGHGQTRLEVLTLEDSGTGQHEDVAAGAVFVMIGAEARTQWLPDAIRRDDHGFILTGADVPVDTWSLARSPLPFETSMPGVFAVGDVRHGSIKRVAGAVGEGSVAVGSIHRYLAEAAKRLS